MTTSEDEIDLQRLERGLGLEGEKIGEGRWRVEGGSEPHWVDLRTPEYPRCDCGDYLWREQTCKHILAARLREGDPAVVSALGKLVQALRFGADNKEASR